MSAGYMTGIYARMLIKGVCSLFSCVLKFALVLGVLLAPYALERAVDKFLGNSLPPVVEKEHLQEKM